MQYIQCFLKASWGLFSILIALRCLQMSGTSLAVLRDIRIMAAISSTSGSWTSAWLAGLVESRLVLGISGLGGHGCHLPTCMFIQYAVKLSICPRDMQTRLTIQTAADKVLPSTASTRGIHSSGWRMHVCGSLEYWQVPTVHPDPRLLTYFMNHLLTGWAWSLLQQDGGYVDK